LEALDAQDLDRLQADLKEYSSVFNQHLQALAAANPPLIPDLAGTRISCVDTNDPFIETVCTSQTLVLKAGMIHNRAHRIKA
jgi:hypothetical protein